MPPLPVAIERPLTLHLGLQSCVSCKISGTSYISSNDSVTNLAEPRAIVPGQTSEASNHYHIMAESLLQPVGSLSPAEALKLAQQAPEILRKNPKAFSASPLSSLFSTRETADTWTIYENLMIACLQTGDDEAANECLERIVNRFGDSHDRVLALKGLVKEATASNNSELEKILEEYEALLQQNDASIVSGTLAKACLGCRTNSVKPIRKRKVALLRSMGKLPEAVTALNSLLDVCPTDPEAWAELADMYVTQGLYSQAVYALEEVLVLSPNAWNVSAIAEDARQTHGNTDESTDSRSTRRSIVHGCHNGIGGGVTKTLRRGCKAILSQHRAL